ncbi:MAG: bifunctional 2',3'-cyclic-nucleotide 2'-phosphodiesterase/3'-nucleotidase, partial [Paracoccaceae bacterium]|nr:bifunctional 2',3'-cyclic-nucleotide 2'-phosphodiesterase/3'-nucleotidase [Paracoccaceae bacterium]
MTETPDRHMPGQLEEPRTTIALRIIETTDLHGYVQGYDYFTDQPQSEVGLARLGSLIAEARAQAPNSLLLDNGDFLQGTPLTEYWARVRGLAEAETHPVIAAMNALDYDAAAPGNHEFNYGLDFLRRALAGARFPLVCANALTTPPGGTSPAQTLLPPWVILERDCVDQTGAPHRLRIGVIGFLPPQTAAWDVSLLEGQLWTPGIQETARTCLPALRAAGVDLVIALAHTGIAATPPAGQGDDMVEHAALQLAALEGIDVLLCGHSHLCFPGPGTAASPGIDPVRGTLHGKPAMIPGRWGSHLGVMDLRLERHPEGWRLAGFATDLRPACPRLPEDPMVLQVNADAHAETLAYIRRAVGHLSVPLHSYFSLVAPDAGLTLVAQAQAAHVAHCLTGRPEAELPLLSAVAPFKCGGRGGPEFFLDLAPGPLQMSHISDLYVFPNMVTALEITGAELADWLERSAGVFAQLIPGQADQ